MELGEYPEPNPNLTVQTPSFAQMQWLLNNVRALGGSADWEIHRPQGIPYPAEDGLRTVMVNTCGCGNPSVAFVPYRRPDGFDGKARICVVCDGGIEWPRLQGGDGPEPAEPEDSPLTPEPAGIGWHEEREPMGWES